MCNNYETFNVNLFIYLSLFQTGSSGSSSYFQIFFLVTFILEDFIKNTIIILCINYKIQL